MSITSQAPTNRTLHPVELDLLVSLRGVEAWRLHRAGIHPALIAEMYPDTDTFPFLHATGIMSVLGACARTEAFGTAAQLAVHIRTVMSRHGERVQQHFEGGMFFPADVDMFPAAYGLTSQDPAASTLCKFVTSMMSYGGAAKGLTAWQLAYTTAAAEAWFAICDAALTVDTAVPA